MNALHSRTRNYPHPQSMCAIGVIASDPFIAQGLAFYLNSEPTFHVQITCSLYNSKGYHSLLRMLTCLQINTLVIQTHSMDDAIIQICNYLHRTRPEVGLLVLLATHDKEQYHLAMNNSVRNIIFYDNLKSKEFVAAVKLVASGKRIVHQEIEQARVTSLNKEKGTLDEYNGQAGILTPREVEVFSYLADGLSNQEIAEKLCVTIKTVKNHLTTIYTKLCVKSRSEAIVEYYKITQFSSNIEFRTT